MENAGQAPDALPGVGAPAPGRGLAVRFVAATTISAYGDWLTVVAVLVLLYELTGSLVAPAGYTLVRVVARLVGPMPGGALADRFSASHIVVAGSAALAALAALLIAAASLRSVWLLYIGVGLSQLITSMVRPAYPAVLGQLSAGRGQGTANALSAVGMSSGIFVGPAVGALLLPVTGARGLIALDAASFAVIPVLMLGIRTTGTGHIPGHPPRTALTEGVSLLVRDRTLRLIAVLHLGSGVASASAQAVLVVAAIQRFGGAAHVGALYSSVGAGSLLGGALALRWRVSPATTRVLLAAFLAEMAGLTMFAVAPTLPGAVIALAVAGVAGVLYQTWGYTELQRAVAPELQGRIFGAVSQGQNVGLALGAVVSVGLITGVRWPAIITGCVVVATSVVTLTDAAPLSPRTRRRRRSQWSWAARR